MLTHLIPRLAVASQSAAPLDWDWSAAPALEFSLADGSGAPRWATRARLFHTGALLGVRFDCEDPHIWATLTRRDEPIYHEEVVELFICAGEADPHDYFELEINPDGVLFDARILNPRGRNDGSIHVGLDWDCPGIRWQARREDAQQRWSAAFVIPWVSIAPAGPLPRAWRGNLYRIERPAEGPAENSCWSPTLAQPVDYHRPDRFGLFVLE